MNLFSHLTELHLISSWQFLLQAEDVWKFNPDIFWGSPKDGSASDAYITLTRAYDIGGILMGHGPLGPGSGNHRIVPQNQALVRTI